MEERFMVIKWDVTIPPLTGDKIRRGYVYLPESYDREPEKRYPVMCRFACGQGNIGNWRYPLMWILLWISDPMNS